MSDDRLMDGIRLTADAYEAGRLSALRDVQALLEDGALLQDLTEAVRGQIANLASPREGEQ